MFKNVILILIMLVSQVVFAGSFDKTTEITNIMAYAQGTNHARNECVLYFKDDTATSCRDKARGVVNTETEIGRLMCSVALAAFMAEKEVTVSSHDDCSPIHGAPFIRYVRVNR